MKKIILYGLILFGLAACKKNKNEPDQRPDERLTAELSAYQAQLSGAQNGWIGYLYPKGGGSYTFKFKFNDKNRVVMYSDIDVTKAATAAESSYRLRATQLPSLYFDTYNYLHVLSDPDPERNPGGVEGEGYQSDFEFSFLTKTTDTIKLKGNLNGSSLVLVRATATEGDDYIAKSFANNASIAKINNFQYYYNKITIGSKEYNFVINTDIHTISFYYDNSGFKRFTTEYATTANGMVLRQPFIDGANVVSEFHDITYNLTAGTGELYSGITKLSMSNVATALTFDNTAPAKMFTTKHDFFSDKGFTIAGVVDAHGITTSIPGFVGIGYVINAFTNPLDAMFFYFNGGALRYGPVFNTRLSTDGKMLFVAAGFANQGTSPGAAGVTAVNKFAAVLTQTSGFYLFETGTNSYDLVSVSDSKNWIRFH